jgi:tetratricopeptide (TPR) repeat protein
MAQQATNPKIEELRFRIKTDPKSRLFYQLAEELRKVKAYEEAEQVLRTGLAHNPAYLAAWVSLGRALREGGKPGDSIEAFTKALQLDPGNAVAARLMADAYLEIGEKLEAVKKYKLVRALLPVDEDLNALIDRLEDEVNPITIHKEPEAVTAAAEAAAAEDSPFATESPFAGDDTRPKHDEDSAAPPTDAEVAVATADVEPMRVAHEESPFEEPAAPASTADALDLEQPLGMHLEPAPVTAEVPGPALWPDEGPAADVFEPSEPAPVAEAAPASPDDIANTVTMADLYVQQGFIDRAQSIYESILDKDPNNEDVRAKLDALDSRPRGEGLPAPAEPPVEAASAPNRKAEKLEEWLAKMKRGEERRV